MSDLNIERAKRFIDKNLEKPLSLEEVSRESGMSRYHFARMFKAYTGMTFKTYHNEMRIEAAKALLQNRENRISEVCYAVGYNDLSYFNRVFRRYVGMSPSSYQKQL
jgi:AraC-like DNA-binding protein